jgi:hypothetical protein
MSSAAIGEFDADVSEVIVQVPLESSDSVPQRVLRAAALPGIADRRKSGGYAGDLPHAVVSGGTDYSSGWPGRAFPD